jgi:hypothetical protein
MVLVAVFVVVGCTPVALSTKGQQVNLMKADPPAGCQEIGSVHGKGNAVGRPVEDNSKIEIRNAAGDKGANYVRLETIDNFGEIAGTAYKCPEPPAASATQ